MLSLMLPLPVFAEASSSPQTAELDPGAVVIEANSLEIDNARKIIIFNGSVQAKKDDMTINCEEMRLYYNERSSDGAEGKRSIEIDKIVATEKVRIRRSDEGMATAEKAVYFQDGEKVVLTGNPMVKQGSDFVEGSTITLFLKEKRSIVEGSQESKVKAVVFPK
jgi:lipopolysaccharide export system protein LptA